MRILKGIGLLLGVALLAPAAAEAQEGREREVRGFMGIGFEWAEENAREARVGQVVPGSGAERAGVRRGDVVLRIDGDPATEETVGRLRERLSPGDTVRLRLRRDGRELDQPVVAGEMRRSVMVLGEDGETVTVRVPEAVRMRMDTVRRHLEQLHTRMDSLRGRLEIIRADSAVVYRFERDTLRLPRGRVHLFGDSTRRVWIDTMRIVHADSLRRAAVERIHGYPFSDLDPDVPFFLEVGRRGVAGAELAPMNPGLARYFRTERGVLVLQVSENAPMARAGVQAGDVIVRAGDADVRDVADLRRAFAAAGSDGRLGLQVIREGQSRTMELQWEPVRRRTESRTRERSAVEAERRARDAERRVRPRN